MDTPSYLDLCYCVLVVFVFRMLIYASSLGCKMRHKKEADGNITTTVVLKVPLKFPETKKRLKR